MAEISEQRVLETIHAFVANLRGPHPITLSTRLLGDGLLDSFALIELIATLEKALGIEIPSGHLIPEDFETPAVLCERLRDL